MALDPLLGSRATLLMDFESSLGTTKGTTVPKKVGFVSETLSGTQNLLTSPTIRADGNKAPSVNGNITAAGTLTFVSTIDAAPWILKLFTHAISTSGSMDPYTHTFKWDITSVTMQSAVMELAFTSSIIKLIQGARIKKINMKLMSEGFLLWTIDYVALTATYTTSATLVGTTTDWTGSTELHMLQGALADLKITTVAASTTSGNAAALREFEIDANVNITEDDYRIFAAGARGGLPVGALEVTLKFKMAISNSTHMNFIQSTTAQSFDATFTAAANRTLQVVVPAFRVQKTLPNVESDMGVYCEVTGKAEYDSTAATSLKFVVVNGNAGTVYA